MKWWQFCLSLDKTIHLNPFVVAQLHNRLKLVLYRYHIIIIIIVIVIVSVIIINIVEFI